LLSLSSLLTIALPQASATTIMCNWAYSGGGNNNFSSSANWQNCNGGAPTGNGTEELVFPINPGTITNANNDLSGASFTDIRFIDGGVGDSGYVITGNSITTGDVTDQSTTQNGNELNLDIGLAGSQVNFAGSSSSQLIIGDPTNVGSHSLTLGNTNPLQLTDTTMASSIVGNTTVNITSPNGDSGVSLLASSPSFTGTINSLDGTFSLDNSSSSAVTVSNGGTLKGNGGSAPSITVGGGGTIAPGHSPGCLTAGSQLVINGTYQAEIAGTTACSQYDQITSGGTTDLTGSTLTASLLNGFTPAVGNSFTIIKNTGGGAITGTFAGLPEGGTFTVGSITFAITYQGNGENDVVLTVASIAAPAAAAPTAPDTGLALIAAHPGTVLAITLLASATLLVLARRLKPVK
jgi:hypothetical protein